MSPPRVIAAELQSDFYGRPRSHDAAAALWQNRIPISIPVSIRDLVDQSQARAILHLKAEIVRVRSFGQSQLYKFWAFKVDEITDPVWTDGAATTSTVWLTTDYGQLDGTGYRDRRKFRIDPGGRVSLIQASSHDGSIVEGRNAGRLASGVARSVAWPGTGR